MHRWLLALCFAMGAGLPVAHADIVYTWEGTCTSRRLIQDFVSIELPCPEVTRGVIRLPDDYVPGTAFDYSDRFDKQLYGFTLFDPVFDGGSMGMCCASLWGRLPSFEGPGDFFEGSIAPGGITISPSSWSFFIGFTHSGSHAFETEGTFSIFRRIPEPSTLALALAALLGPAVAAAARRRVRPLPAA